MIQINPLQSYIDGGARAALTTPPSASLVFDLPGKAIWVKGVKLKGIDHTYTFSHDNYITLTNTPDKNNPESEDINIGVNITTLKNVIDTTYNGGTLALLQEGLNTEERTWLAKILHNYINNVLPITKNIQINGTNYAIYTTEDSLPLFFAPVSLGTTGQILACTSTGLSWVNLIQNTDYRVSLSSATNDNDYRIILKQGADNNPETNFVRFSEYLTFNPSTKTLKINNIKVVTASDIYVGSAAGLVPSATSEQLNYYLRGDGTWVSIATEMATANTWRPIKVGNTDALGSGTNSGILSFAAGTGITLAWDATNNKITITNSSSDENVRQVPKTDNINRPLMMINGSTSAGEQVTTSMFSTGIYANASTKMITANGFIKAGSSDDYVLLGGGDHKALNDFSISGHTHNYITIPVCSSLNINSDVFSVEYAGGNNSVATKPSDVDAFGVMRLRTANGWYGLIMMSANAAPGIYYRNANGLSSSVGWVKLLDTNNYSSILDTRYITDITTSTNKLIFTKNGSNINRDITVNVVYSLGNLTNIADKNFTTKASSGLFIYNSYNLVIGTNLYSSVLSINTGGTIQIAGNWGDDLARNLYWRSLSDRAVSSYPWKSWRTILDSENYSSTLDSRYYTESEVNNLLNTKLNRQNLSYGTWNPRGYNLAADYSYNGGDLSISESGGKIHISVDGYFWLNEGQYRVLDTSDVSGLKNDLTVHLYLSTTDTTWYPLIWGGSIHNNTNDSTGPVFKSYDKLSWLTSSLTLYTTHLRTTDLNTLTALFHPNNDSTLKIYSGRTLDAVSDGHIGLQTSIDNTDGQTHAYPTLYSSRCVLALLPRGGSVYIGNMPNGGNGRKLNVNGDIGLFNVGSIRDLAIGGGIYWNPYVESTTDSSNAASITVVKSGVAGGTTLVLSLMNDANDTILFLTSTAARLYHNSYPILTTLNTYVNNNKGYINGTEITLVNNSDKVDGYHASSLWRSDGATWNPGANISLNASANSQEWSFDIRRNGYTGCYWHVLDSSRGSMLTVNADNGKVYAPYNFVGNLEGNASSSTKSTYSRSLLGRNTSGSDYDASDGNLVFAEWNTMSDSRWYLKATGYECRVNYATNAASATYANYLKTRNTNITISSSTWANNPWGASNMTVVWGQSGKYSSVSSDTADITLQYGTLSSGGAGWFLNIDGGIYTLSSIYAPSYYTNSDIRYKNIISNIELLAKDIANLPLFTYLWKDGRKDKLVHVGSSAQSVEILIPELVSLDNNGFRSLDYPILGVVAGITACKELVTLKSELLQLKEKVKLLEDRLRKYENTL